MSPKARKEVIEMAKATLWGTRPEFYSWKIDDNRIFVRAYPTCSDCLYDHSYIVVEVPRPHDEDIEAVIKKLQAEGLLAKKATAGMLSPAERLGRYPKNWTSCLRDDILKNKKQTYDNKSKFNQ